MSNFLTRALIESDSNYAIERSLRFMSASSQYLTRTLSADGSQTKCTISLWVKRGSLSSAQNLVTAWTDGNNNFQFNFTPNNELQIYEINSGVVRVQKITARLFRDTTAFYHIVFEQDYSQGVAEDKTRLYVNGVRITSWSSNTNNHVTSSGLNVSAYTHNIGRIVTGGNYFDGYISELNWVTGTTPSYTLFGETNPTTGQWVAKKYTGTYGTNGFYLDFKDGTSTTTLGQDKSGNNNHWTLTNFTRSAGINDCWMLDVPAGNGSASAVQPSGNYAVINSLQPASASISEGNLKYLNSSGGANQTGITIELPTGFSFYFEGVPSTQPAANDFSYIGNSSCYYCSSGKIFVNGSVATTVTGFVNGDVVAIAGTVGGAAKVYKNNILMYDATTAICSLSTVINTYSNGVWQMNFGQRSFAYTPPTGFKALCTANLPTPVIKKPSDHFNVQLSTGANIKTDSEALFTNELEWIKDRANANNHQLIDSVRGSNAVLQSNTTAAETTYTAPSGSSVGWVWRASDSAAVTNTDGSISSQVSANPTAGFSIVTYTGTGANATVGHGLGIAPKMVIVKNRGTTGDWQVRHGDIAVANSIQLNLTNSAASATTVWNSTAPTSAVFSIGTDASVNGNTNTYVAYCFAEIPGYSKFGSYTGNGSADGINVTLGFKPRFIMFKRTDSASAWVMYDTARDTYNPVSLYIQAQASAAEASAVTIDANSNGFKIRTSGDPNVNGGTYIYMAFAESPINYANAR